MKRKFDAAAKRAVDALLLPVPGVRTGTMFGYPAYYVGRRLLACHYGGKVGIKVPVALAQSFIRTGRARAFRPYGKARMREWLAITWKCALERRSAASVLRAAVAYAKELG